MGVTISLSLSQGTPNTTARTTTVSAKVTIRYDQGSYDGTQPSGEVTIDGQSFPFVKNFNYAGYQQGAVSQSGSTSITITAPVEYGTSSSRTVYVSASFSRASNSASGSITLTPISSGGSSGGGDDDDDNTEEWNPDNPGSGGSGGFSDSVYYSRAATVHNTGGFSLSSGDAYSIRFTAPEFSGTSMHIRVTLEGVAGHTDPLVGVALCTSDVNLSKYQNTSELVTDAYRLGNEYLYVIPGIENGVAIETSEIKSETDYYLIFWQEDYTFSADKVNVEVFYRKGHFNGNTTLTFVNGRKIGGDGFSFSSSVIKFKTPTFDGISTSIDVAIKAGYDESSHGSQVVGVALCTSSVSYEAYANAGLEVFDRYQIATAMMTIVNDEYGVVNIPTQSVSSNTDYYLILWIPKDYHQGGFYYLDGEIEKHRVRVNYTSAGGGSGTTAKTKGVFYIDNGVGFDKYECFIDNGTSWDCVSGGKHIEFSDTVTTNATESLKSVDCGFSPDLVVLHYGEIYYEYHYSCAAPFGVHNGNVYTIIWSGERDEYIDLLVHREDQGFSVMAYDSYGNPIAQTFNYVAVKYT